MTTRRGFLTSILAMAAAPAIVKAKSIMPIWVPKTELLLPNLDITLDGMHPNQSTTFSMWMKESGGAWTHYSHTFIPTSGTAKLSIPLKEKNPVVYGLQLEGLKTASVNLNVTQNGSLRLDTSNTPFIKKVSI